MILSSVNTFLLVIISVVHAVEMRAPSFSAIQNVVKVKVGDTANLPCSVKSLGSFKIVWMSPTLKTLTLEDRRITSDERVSLERPYVNDWNLHVREAVRADAGVYQCQINTNPIQKKRVQLVVEQPSTIIESLSSSKEVKVTEGDTVQLVCNVTGFPTPEVTWYRLANDKKKKTVGTKGEVLMIYNVSRFCDDDYECVAFNGVQPADRRKLSVRVQFAPEVRLPNKNLGQVKGLYTILECQVTAYPQSISSWRYKGKDITGSDDKYVMEVYNEEANGEKNTITLALKIQHIEAEDYGDYECYSENFLGRDSEIMQLYEYIKETTTQSTTTTTTTTTTPRRWRNGYRGNGDDAQSIGYNGGYGGRNNNRRVDSYNPYSDGHESKLPFRKNEHNRNADRNNDRGRDGSVQSVISDPENAAGRLCRPEDRVNVILLAVAVTALSRLVR